MVVVDTMKNEIRASLDSNRGVVSPPMIHLPLINQNWMRMELHSYLDQQKKQAIIWLEQNRGLQF